MVKTFCWCMWHTFQGWGRFGKHGHHFKSSGGEEWDGVRDGGRKKIRRKLCRDCMIEI